MTLLVPNGGEAIILNYITNKDVPEDLDLLLYTNNYTPVEASVIGSFTEMSTQGYAAKALAASDWTVTEGDPSDATAAQQTFTFDGTGGSTSVYGYLLKRHTSGEVVWAEKFSDGPYTIANNGDAIKVTPKITLADAASGD